MNVAVNRQTIWQTASNIEQQIGGPW